MLSGYDYLKLVLLDHLRKRDQPGTVSVSGYTVRFRDIHTFRGEYKHIFKNRIYHFESNKIVPTIIDGGGYIGTSVLYFKHVYPQARIIVFEPDPDNLELLKSNIEKNGLKDIQVIASALDADGGEKTFTFQGDAGRITQSGKAKVKVERLSKYVADEVDFLKLNIEGGELEVLEDLEKSGKLKLIKETCIEWHSFAGQEQNLGDGLAILQRNSFKYLINDFDYPTNPSLRPPFKLSGKSQYYLLVYARRNDLLES